MVILKRSKEICSAVWMGLVVLALFYVCMAMCLCEYTHPEVLEECSALQHND